MKILLLGHNGQVGWELQRALAPLGDIVAPGRNGAATADAWTDAATDAAPGGVAGNAPGHGGPLCGDLSRPDALAATVQTVRPTVIVNAAAYTAVDRAESEVLLAETINATAPGVLAEAAAQTNALLIHYSTDYVFDGSGTRAWTENDIPAPLCIYGRTKLEGERRIQASGCRHLILRTSWVYAARGSNFVRTMLRLAQTREQLNVINDQWGAPTSAELLADVTAHTIRHLLAHPRDCGLYHCTASGATTWHAYASDVIAQARQLWPGRAFIDPAAITPVATSAYPTAARRPANSRLDTRKLQHTFNLRLPHWQTGVRRMLQELPDPSL